MADIDPIQGGDAIADSAIIDKVVQKATSKLRIEQFFVNPIDGRISGVYELGDLNGDIFDVKFRGNFEFDSSTTPDFKTLYNDMTINIEPLVTAVSGKVQ